MLKFNNSIVPNKVHIGWHFSSNKYAYRTAVVKYFSLYLAAGLVDNFILKLSWNVVWINSCKLQVPTVVFHCNVDTGL